MSRSNILISNAELLKTLELLEPEAGDAYVITKGPADVIPTVTGLSIAISLKRIADLMARKKWHAADQAQKPVKPPNPLGGSIFPP